MRILCRSAADPPATFSILSVLRIPGRSVGRSSRLIALCCACLMAGFAVAQVPDTSGSRRDSLSARPDSAAQMAPDTVRSPQTPPDSVGALPGVSDALSPFQARPADTTGGLDNPVTFTAADSLALIFDDEGQAQRGELFLNSKVVYGEATLEAWQINLDFQKNELAASGLVADTGMVGRPQFSSGEETFTGTRLAYNLETERGRVEGAQTRIEDGFINAGVVKVREDSTLFIQGGAYTTCNCPSDPSYSLRSGKMKIVDQEWIYTGPIQLYIFNIPTPLWLPFGFLPAKEGRRTGPLPPQYGEDERGFFLRDFGWYFALSQYTDLQLRGGLWSKGSWQVSPFFRYNRRYRYSGQFQVDYVRNRQGERGDPDFGSINTASIRWNHSQTINPTSNFGANVNLSSSGYLKTISEDYNDRVRQTVSSSIRYNKRWPNAGRSFSIDANQTQNLQSGNASMTLPSLSFSQASRKPFARKERAVGTGEAWFERLTWSYSGSLSNRYNFTPLASDTSGIAWYDALFNPSLYRRTTGQQGSPFDFRATHSIPVSASWDIRRLPLTRMPFRLNMGTSISYNEEWLGETERRFIDTTNNQVTRTQVAGFMAFRRVSMSASANTTIYGIFPWRIGRFDGFRHTVRPSLSYSFSPDLTTPFWGYTRTYIDKDGKEVRYPIVPGAGRESQTMSISIANVFESRLARPDSVAENTPRRTIQLFDFNINTFYNFAAPSQKLGLINLDARTNLSQTFSLSFRTTFSPYEVAQPGTIPRYMFSWGRFWEPLRVTEVNFSGRTSFRSKNAAGGQPYSPTRARMTGAPDPLAAGFPEGGIDPFRDQYRNTAIGYADFAIPWSLDVDFSYSLSRPGSTTFQNAVVNTSFDFNITPRWKVQGRTGIDLIERDLVTTNLVILRDFECWEMGLNWIPFGDYQSFGFDLHVKSGKLRDILRLRQPRDDIQGRFSGLTGR